MDNSTLEAIVVKGRELNERVDRLRSSIDAGQVTHLDLVPTWAHDAVADWADGNKPSVSLKFINHVNSAVRIIYSVERKARQDQGWSVS